MKLECVSCKNKVSNDDFGIFIWFEPRINVDMGIGIPMIFKKSDGMIQVKICKECLKKNYVNINPFEERDKILREYEEEKNNRLQKIS